MTTHAVYVPVDPRLLIDAASGVTARTLSAGSTLLLDFEGNRYDAENLVTWADRVASAAGRASSNYPTMARTGAEPDQVVLVGEYDDATGEITLLDEQLELTLKWLGLADSSELARERFTTSVTHINRRYLTTLENGSPEDRLAAPHVARFLRV